MHRGLRSLHVAALAAGALCLMSCAATLEKRAQAGIAQALPGTLGPAARYEVEVEGAARFASSFARVHATGERVARPGAPVIDRLEAHLEDVVLDPETRRVTSIGGARVRAHIREQDLAAWLLDRGWIDRPRVMLRPPAAVVVPGVPRLTAFPLPDALGVELRGRLVARGPQLRLRADSVAVAGVEVPAFARALLEEAVNPLFDTSAYVVPSTLDSVRVEGDALVVFASGSGLTAFPSAQTTSASARCAAAMVWSTSASECAPEKKKASTGEGGR